MGVFFQSSSAAARYARARPHFHPHVIEIIGQLLALKTPLPWALDVGCGTGQSTVALRVLATNVLGIDLSEEMLKEALAENQVVYAKAAAEKMELQDNSFQLVTVGQAFHWFNRRAFYLECSRVLQVGGHLFIYGHSLAHSCLDFFDREFPLPFKDALLNSQELDVFDLTLRESHPYQREIELNLTQTVNYLMTMSAVEKALETAHTEEIEQHLITKLTPAFQLGPLTFQSRGQIWWVQKN